MHAIRRGVPVRGCGRRGAESTARLQVSASPLRQREPRWPAEALDILSCARIWVKQRLAPFVWGKVVAIRVVQLHKPSRMRRLVLVAAAVVAIMFAGPAHGACGRVAGVFCNGGYCAAGVCQCPIHLVGPNW
jgi:hypothetical protein